MSNEQAENNTPEEQEAIQGQFDLAMATVEEILSMPNFTSARFFVSAYFLAEAMVNNPGEVERQQLIQELTNEAERMCDMMNEVPEDDEPQDVEETVPRKTYQH